MYERDEYRKIVAAMRQKLLDRLDLEKWIWRSWGDCWRKGKIEARRGGGRRRSRLVAPGVQEGQSPRVDQLRPLCLSGFRGQNNLQPYPLEKWGVELSALSG